MAKQLGQPVPAVTDLATLTGAEGLELMHEALGQVWPGITHTPRASPAPLGDR
jgi:hypothetical protein